MRLCITLGRSFYITSHLKESSYHQDINIIKTKDILIIEYHLLVCKILHQYLQIREDNETEDKTTLIIILFELN